MTRTALTDTQRLVLEQAAEQPDGRANWFPDNVKGGARKKVIDGLCNKALITGSDTDWFISPGGYDALGRTPPVLPSTHPDPEVEAVYSTQTGHRFHGKLDTHST